MSVLVEETTTIVVSPLSSAMARFQCHEMVKGGTRLVGAVRDESAAFEADPSIPIIDNFTDAVVTLGAEVAVFFDEPLRVKDRVIAAIDAGITTLVVLTEYVPVHDALEMRNAAISRGANLIGPNSSGVLAAGRSKAGYFSDEICAPGDVGIITKGGSIAYGILSEMKRSGLGISTIVSVGPDLVKGADYASLLPLFENDANTKRILLLGEIGGYDEEAAAKVIVSQIRKPVVAYVCGKYVKEGQVIGHAGAIIHDGVGDYQSKVLALMNAGVAVSEDFESVIPLLLGSLDAAGITPEQIDNAETAGPA
jgi:succinyl-CoA synthetase alpha subunit